MTHSKGRLLAYLVWFGKIRCVPSVPADIMRAIGYKSPGHWSLDIKDLMSGGYIILEEGRYKPTDKAKSLLEPLVNLKKIALLNLVASGVILFVGFFTGMLGGQPLFFIWNFLIAVYLALANIHGVTPFYLLFKKAPRKEF